MNSGELNQSQVSPGDRGLTTIRHMSKNQFENVYNNIAGFEDSYLCWSSHEVWGAIAGNSIRVLEAYINLDLIQNSYSLDRGHSRPRLVINQAFIDRIKWVFWVFYNQEQSAVYTANSSFDAALTGRSELDWRTPEVIVVYMSFSIDGETQVFPIMENSLDSSEESAEDLFTEGSIYIDECSQRYSAFLDRYRQFFDENGNQLRANL